MENRDSCNTLQFPGKMADRADDPLRYWTSLLFNTVSVEAVNVRYCLVRRCNLLFSVILIYRLWLVTVS